VASRADVELDIFSGRPNPTWTLSDAGRAQFLDRLAALPAAPPAGLRSNLGYRGFVVHLSNGPRAGVVHVQRGTIRVSMGERDLYYNDPQRLTERWLLQTGEPFLEPGIHDIVDRELSG